jgi:endonuclease I
MKIRDLSGTPGNRGSRVSPSTYYAPAQGKEGVDLLRSLHNVVTEGHKERTYENARHMMFAVVDDLDNNNVVADLYTGQKTLDVSGLRTATKAGLTAEHAWPQSRGATEIAKSDMHSLFPANNDINTRRSNLPYGDVEKAEWASPADKKIGEISLIGTDTEGRKVFEPRASMRGDVARAQLYFFTRYHGDQPKRFTLNDFRESLPTLLEWNKADPPDAGERARNEAIYRLQGNRNPYVDHPNYVDRIGFSESMLRRPMKKPASES